jgi:pectinesterase
MDIPKYRSLALGLLLLNPPALARSFDVVKDVVYSAPAGRRLLVDLYLPQGSGPFPALLFLHGGGWRNGKKEDLHRLAERMAAQNFVGACVEYRLSGEAKYPAALFDAKSAVRWMRANAVRYKADPNRIGVVGSSAGGELAAMLGTTADERTFEAPPGEHWENQGVSSRVAAVVAFNPVVDFVEWRKEKPEAADTVGGGYLGASYAQDPKLWAEASPIHYVTKDAPPFLLLHGTADASYPQSTLMVTRLRAAGAAAELFTADGGEHGFFNQDRWFEETMVRMEQFLRKTLP